MFEWVVAIVLTPELIAARTGHAAAELAYTTLSEGPATPEPTPGPAPRPIDPNCGTCRGTGKVRTGDGQHWTKCPTCQAEAVGPTQVQQKTPAPNVPAFRQSAPLPNAGILNR